MSKKTKQKQVRLTPACYSDEIEKRMQERKKMRCPVPPKWLLRTPEQIAGIRASGVINTALLDHVAAHIKAGMTTEEVNNLVYSFTIEHDSIPATLNYEGYPKSTCVSINEVVCHGIPSSKVVLKEGDIVNVDVTTIHKGFYADASRMFMIGEVSEEKRQLVEVTRECLEIGVRAAQPWARIGDIGAAIQAHAEKYGYGIVDALAGHGVGVKFHEEPQVNHYGKAGTGMLIVPGMTFTVEPMINMGTKDVLFDKYDGWTVRTADGKPSAQWEHTLLITEDGNEIITY